MVTLTAMNPPDDIRHKQAETAAFVGETDFGLGTLYISESFVIWISNDGHGFSLPYPTISMHAISRNSQSFPRPCIYMAIDNPTEKKMAACSLKVESVVAKTETTQATDASGDGEHNGSSHNGSEAEGGDEAEDGEGQTVEMRFVPADVGSLEPIYQALSECQALHPDENESFSEDEEEGDTEGQFGGASDEFRFDESGQLVLSHMRGVRRGNDEDMDDDAADRRHDDDEMETGQFDDA